ncbi:hypothetical protein [Pedobacter sp. Leaf216]|uniref:hypothetical protein n=1 Tax=Pedobacter sp. Leaf216 TaxID=1735684 RepID=UPI000AA1D601|nr:hypothetical protein [Pedobacter sp. Leaf216]
MRLISCIGMLMVIPAVALLTMNKELQPPKSPAGNHIKLPSNEMESVTDTDSLSHQKMLRSNHPTSVRHNFPSSSYAQSKPLFTK